MSVLNDERLAQIAKEIGPYEHPNGMISAFGEYTPDGVWDLIDTIADLKRQVAEWDAAVAAAEEAQSLRIFDAIEKAPCGMGDLARWLRKNVKHPHGALDAYVQERVDRERREVSDWIDAYAKSEGLEITLETKTTEERIKALCTLLSAKAAHERDRAVLIEHHRLCNYCNSSTGRKCQWAANRAKVGQ